MTTVQTAGDPGGDPTTAAIGPSTPGQVSVWEDDPGAPPSSRTPVARAKPALGTPPLAVDVAGSIPTDVDGAIRYWTAADALTRVVSVYEPYFPASAYPSGPTWNPAVGGTLTANLNAGNDLNAYYDRTGLSFFRQTVSGVTVWSGDSPDVVCHETGHAILDSLVPGLWNAASAEIAAFHESFGDMTALLSGLSLASLREEVLGETSGDLSRSSRLSRLAEQLGWAVRQFSPSSVDPDCLRNAANEFFYADPVTLSPSGPASQLSSEPHSFSRVFTGAFLRSVAGMAHTLAGSAEVDDGALMSAGADAAALLVAAVTSTGAVPAFYAQVAAHLIAADQQKFSGRYTAALQAAFVRHGILSPAAAKSVADRAAPVAPNDAKPDEYQVRAEVPSRPAGGPANLPSLVVSGEPYGLGEQLNVEAPTEEPRFAVAGAAASTGQLTASSGEEVATAFVEDLFRQGKVAVPAAYRHGFAATAVESARRTHEVSRTDGGGLVLVRRFFD